MIWRTTNEEMDPKSTVKHGDVFAPVCYRLDFGKLVFIDGNMTGEMHRRILENNLLDCVKMISLTNEWIFQHDNDPKHRAPAGSMEIRLTASTGLLLVLTSILLNIFGMRLNVE